jgi:putative spermidine/putrescine transport system substrate-binding protein
MPAIEITRLSEEWQDRFAGLPRGPATLPDDVLSANRLPELQAAWRIAAEQAWEENVLKQ